MSIILMSRIPGMNCFHYRCAGAKAQTASYLYIGCESTFAGVVLQKSMRATGAYDYTQQVEFTSASDMEAEKIFPPGFGLHCLLFQDSTPADKLIDDCGEFIKNTKDNLRIVVDVARLFLQDENCLEVMRSIDNYFCTQWASAHVMSPPHICPGEMTELQLFSGVMEGVNKINVEAKRSPIFSFRWLLRERSDKTLVTCPLYWSYPMQLSQKGGDVYFKSVWRYMACTFDAPFIDDHDLTCRIRLSEPAQQQQADQQGTPQQQQIQHHQGPRSRQQRQRPRRVRRQRRHYERASQRSDVLRGVRNDSRLSLSRNVIDREIARLVNLRSLISGNGGRDGLADLFSDMVSLRN